MPWSRWSAADAPRYALAEGGRLVRSLSLLAVVWPFLFGFFRLTGGPGWWQSWVVCAELLVPMTIFALWAARARPEFLARRARYREKEASQRRLLRAANPVILASYALPGIDRRLGWSDVPLGLQLSAMGILGLGYLLILAVFVANPWAGRTVETEADQPVISTGPYAVVRHPMYVGVLAMFLSLPIALGSLVALLPAAFTIPVLVIRIRDEEEVLRRDLPGYEAYTRRVRSRLVPGVW
jgi:protein-S-isoprenylcysteine O-methyltransferase Ste14